MCEWDWVCLWPNLLKLEKKELLQQLRQVREMIRHWWRDQLFACMGSRWEKDLKFRRRILFIWALQDNHARNNHWIIRGIQIVTVKFVCLLYVSSLSPNWSQNENIIEPLLWDFDEISISEFSCWAIGWTRSSKVFSLKHWYCHIVNIYI